MSPEAHEIVAMLKAGSVSPLQLIDVVEQRISATEALVHATPITCFDRAREKAWEIMRNCAEKRRGFLHGLPILIKAGNSRKSMELVMGKHHL